jgi:Flp pilus assembly protein protease CpaA
VPVSIPPSLCSSQTPILLCFLLLSCASLMDMKSGFVSNRFWLAAISVASALSIYISIVADSSRILFDIAFSFAATLLIATILFGIGLFGGSDAKALILVSVLVPTLSPLYHSSTVPILTSLSALANIALLLTLVLATNAVHNLLILHSEDRAPLLVGATRMDKLLFLCGYRKTQIGVKQYGQLCRTRLCYHGDSPRVIVLRNSWLTKYHAPPSARRGNGDVDQGVIEAWAPFRIPLIPVITISLLISLLFGDLTCVFLT